MSPAPASFVCQAVVDSIRGRRNALAGTVRSVLLQAEALVPPPSERVHAR